MYLIPFVISYLIGTISPGFFITKLYKHVDIRKSGFNYTGTTNVYKIAGFLPAFLTGLIDFSKGIAAILISYLLWEYMTPDYFQDYFILISAIFVILGHIFPFYLNFRGGRGAATSYGIVVLSLIILVKIGLPFFPILLMIAYTIILFLVFHSFSLSGFIIILILIAYLVLNLAKSSFYSFYIIDKNITFLICIMSLVIIVISSIYTYITKKSLVFKMKIADKKDNSINFYYYFALLIIPFIVFLFSKIICFVILMTMFILLLGILFIQLNDIKKVFKNTNIRFIYFLISILIMIPLFNRNIIIIIASGYISGNVFCYLVEKYFSKIALFEDITLEGFLAFFGFYLLSLITLNWYFSIPTVIIIWFSLFNSVLFILIKESFKHFIIPLSTAILLYLIIYNLPINYLSVF